MIVAGLVVDAVTKEPCRSSSGPLLFEPLETLESKSDLLAPASLAINATGIFRYDFTIRRENASITKANVLERRT